MSHISRFLGFLWEILGILGDVYISRNQISGFFPNRKNREIKYSRN